MNNDTDKGEPICVEGDGCPIELAVLQRFWREHQKLPRWRWVDCGPHEGYFERHPQGVWVKFEDVSAATLPA